MIAKETTKSKSLHCGLAPLLLTSRFDICVVLHCIAYSSMVYGRRWIFEIGCVSIVGGDLPTVA